MERTRSGAPKFGKAGPGIHRPVVSIDAELTTNAQRHPALVIPAIGTSQATQSRTPARHESGSHFPLTRPCHEYSSEIMHATAPAGRASAQLLRTARTPKSVQKHQNTRA